MKFEYNDQLNVMNGTKEMLVGFLPVPVCSHGLLRSEPRSRAVLPPLSLRENACGSAFSLKHQSRATRRARAPLRRSPAALAHMPQG